MKAFVTGSAGFLGSWLVSQLLERGHQVVSCDDFSGGYTDNVPVHRDHRFAAMDVRQTKNLSLLMSGCEVVYHCACLPYEGVSVFSPAWVCDSVYTASVSVMSAAIASRARRVVACSSMARYGDVPAPFHESSHPLPVDPYGLSKLSAEKALTMLGNIHGVEVAHAIPHNIYGPRQRYDDPGRNVVGIFINRMLQGQQPIIYGDGSQVRCFSYVEDVLPTLIHLADCPLKHNGEVFNVGPDEGEVSVLSLADRIAFQLDRHFDPIFKPDRPREVKHAFCSSDKIRKRFGFEQRWPLDAGLAESISYVRQRGPRPFDYSRMPIEILNESTPPTWVERLI